MRCTACVWRAVLVAVLTLHQLVALHVHDVRDDALVTAGMALAHRRRQNDRAQPAAEGAATPLSANIPSVYRRWLSDQAVRQQVQQKQQVQQVQLQVPQASRRWISGVPSDLGEAVPGSPTLPSLVVDNHIGNRVRFPEDAPAPGSPPEFLPGVEVALPADPVDPTDPSDQLQRRLRQKIAKFLNLFTVVQFSNDACEATTVGLTGTCYHHMQCRSLGGHPGGACAQGYGVCCLFEKTCGGVSRHNSTYFVSSTPDEVQTEDGYYNCFLTVEKMHPDVTQLRLDFLHFELAAPTEGSCLDERFVVIGPDRNAPTPALCGTNTGQHMYVQVGSAGGAVRLGVQWRSKEKAVVPVGGVGGVGAAGGASGGRRWVVRLTQLRARDEGAAPTGCLQYHVGHAGQVQSFGYLVPTGSYTNNLNYAICIRKESGFCSVTYSVATVNGTDLPFQLLNEDQDGAPTIPPGQAGAEVFNCPNDYIVVNGIRLCGERLNDASVDADYTHNSPVTDSGSGPFVLPVRSNGKVTGRGFSLSYRQMACSEM